jgi:hypothetical protein
MPFKSKAQQGFMEANKKKLSKQGVNIKEFEQSTDYSKLPAKVKPKKPKAKKGKK